MKQHKTCVESLALSVAQAYRTQNNGSLYNFHKICIKNTKQKAQKSFHVTVKTTGMWATLSGGGADQHRIVLQLDLITV